MVINQGDVYWIDLDEPSDSGPGFRHPHVVVQNDLFNHSRLATVVVCLLTTNLRLASAPGNVLLNMGEANLSRQSVVNVTQLYTVDKADLTEWIGVLSENRVRQIVAGIRLLTEPQSF